MDSNDLLRLIAERSSDFVAVLDTRYRYRALNPAYIHEFERIFGTRLTLGTAVPDALSHLPEERERVMAMFTRALRGEEFSVVQPFGDRARDRGVYEVRFQPILAPDGSLWGSFHVVRDVTARRRAEAESELLKRTTQAIAAAATFEEALVASLNRVCEQTGWATGEAWLPEPGGERVRRAAGSETGDARLLRFHERSRHFAFAPGEGLPGRVWRSGRPEWLTDVSRSPEFLRAGLAAEAGLKAAVGVPAIAAGEVVAVLCFYHSAVGTEDAALVEVVTAVALQLGMHLERRRSEAVLRTVTARYEALLNNIPDLAWLKDRDSHYLAVNDAFGRAFRLPPDAFVGRGDRQLFSAVDAARRRGEDLRVLRSGSRLVSEERNVQPDGSIRHYETITTPIRDASGELTGTVGIARDITDRKLREQYEGVRASVGLALASSLDVPATLRAVAEPLTHEFATWCVVDLLDEDGRFSAAAYAAATPEMEHRLRVERNRCPAVARRTDGWIRRVAESGTALLLPRDVPPPDEGAGPDADVSSTLQELGVGSCMIVPMVTRSRTVGVVTLATGEPGRIYGEGDLAVARELARYAALAIDNAVLYEAAQEARREAEDAVTARDEMLGVVAHDLRNPLSAISLLASLMEAFDAPDKREHHLRTIQGLADQMDRLIQDLLDVRRVEAGRLPLQSSPLMVGAVLDPVVEMLQPLAAEREVGIEVVAPASALLVRADGDRLKQVLSNLVGNAIKFSPAGGTVTIRAERQGTDVVVAVTDGGPGIPEDQLPHVFKRFWQAPDSSRRGAGLGLTIARGIVEAHGGRIWVESVVGEGSTFRFTLPALPVPTGAVPADDPAPPETEAERTPRDPGPATFPVPPILIERPRPPIRVLLVDDHAVLLQGLRRVLDRADDVQVVGAVSSGEEAIDAVASLRPDVVVIDLEMPGIGGLAATRRIAAEPGAPRILALTSDPEEESLLPLLAAGGSGYLRKTRAPAELLEAIRTVARDETFLYPDATKLLLQGYQESAEYGASAVLDQLDERERTMLTLIAEGFTSREIGKKLFLSPSTVDTYRHHLMKKLGLSHRTDVVQFALRTGLLNAD
jgi:PAS domain S-box-containing protein